MDMNRLRSGLWIDLKRWLLKDEVRQADWDRNVHINSVIQTENDREI